MKKIKVFIQYPSFFSDSPYYNYLINFHSKKIEYITTNKERNDIINNKKKLFFARLIKDIGKKLIRKFKVNLLNAYLTKTKVKHDLIHCAHCLSLNKNINWIVDLECHWQIGISDLSKKTIQDSIKILNQKNCRKIICWTKQTKKELDKIMPNSIKNKTIVIYPAVKINKKVTKKSNNLNLVFIARYFKFKGGEYAIKAIDILTKKYKNINGIIVTEDINLAKSYIPKNNKIKFYNLMPRNKLFKKIYPKTDVLIYPGLSDSFGFSYLDAMSFGIPIVTVDGYARNEIIENRKNGFIVGNKNIQYLNLEYNTKLENELIKKTEILIKNKKLRKKMGNYGYNLIKKGKFSIKKQSQEFEKVYEEALTN